MVSFCMDHSVPQPALSTSLTQLTMPTTRSPREQYLALMPTDGGLTMLPSTHFQDPTNTDDACPICTDPNLQDNSDMRVVRTSCNHVFHRTCLVSWLQSLRNRSGTCPYCRHMLYKARGRTLREGSDLSDDELRRRFFEALGDNFDEEEHRNREAHVARASRLAEYRAEREARNARLAEYRADRDAEIQRLEVERESPTPRASSST
ncbi:hypothetical protein BKA63DRAFT_495620 [Paraphoma chrysanthemicola]|nr:hypothetical protein BKA63DRAFT_495620 [Paraphoma chrysanthemicola]